MNPGRELDKLVAEAMGELRKSHPGFYYEEVNTDDGDGWGGFHCPRCHQSGQLDGDRAGECYLHYSLVIKDAWKAWEWLEQNEPWSRMYLEGSWQLLALGREGNNEPSVIFIEDGDFSISHYEHLTGDYKHNFYIPGLTYPHAIALAVVEAAKIINPVDVR